MNNCSKSAWVVAGALTIIMGLSSGPLATAALAADAGQQDGGEMVNPNNHGYGFDFAKNAESEHELELSCKDLDENGYPVVDESDEQDTIERNGNPFGGYGSTSSPHHSQELELSCNNPDEFGYPVVEQGEAVQLELLISGKPATAEQLKNVEWTSGDLGIASVDETGKVTGMRPGSSTIVAKYEGTSAAVTVYVVKADHKLELSCDELDENEDGYPVIDMGMATQLKLQIDGKPATTEQLKNVVWTSDDPDGASVDKTGKVTAHKAGHYYITAEYMGSSAFYTLDVAAPAFEAKPVLDFDGESFYYRLDMKNLPCAENGTSPSRHASNYTVKSWVGEHKHNNPTYMEETPTGKNGEMIGVIYPEHLREGERVHYVVEYHSSTTAGYGTTLRPEVEVMFSCDLEPETDLSKHSEGENNDSDPTRRLDDAADNYHQLIEALQNTDRKDNDVRDREGFKLDESFERNVKDVIIPSEFRGSYSANPSAIAKTEAHVEFGNDGASIIYVFTPSKGHSADELEFTVDGVAVGSDAVIPQEESSSGNDEASFNFISLSIANPTVSERSSDGIARMSVKTEEDGTACLVIAGIKPADLDHTFTVTAGIGDDVKEIKASCLSHLLELQDRELVGTISKTLYNYHVAAKEFNAAQGANN